MTNGGGYSSLRLSDKIPVGVKSYLWGVHQFILHPILVAIAWIKLYGWPWQWQIWLSFIIHDVGYLLQRCQDMDGQSGKLHPYSGAKIMLKLQGPYWHDFVLFHSRTIAKRWSAAPSKLAYADKYAICMYPRWIYVLLGSLSGEITEYVSNGLQAQSPYFNRLRFYYVEIYKKESTIRNLYTMRYIWISCLQDYMQDYIQRNVINVD